MMTRQEQDSQIGTLHRAGHVVLLGRPNVGKSTLLNTLVGFKLSIVSPKPQTTRHRILGITTKPHAQIVYLDSPGLHTDGKDAMNRQLNRVARLMPEEADVIVHVIEALKWTEEDEIVWKLTTQNAAPCFLAINKIDHVNDKGRLLPFVEKLIKDHPYAAVYYISAQRGDGIDAFERDLIKKLPEATALYAEDELTDRSERFLAAELIREQLMLRLHAELPYSTAVEIERFEETKRLTRITAAIWVERDSQKAIVIGAKGAQLKSIGMAARREMERLLERRVYLELWVKVRESWSDDAAALKYLGYSD